MTDKPIALDATERDTFASPLDVVLHLLRERAEKAEAELLVHEATQHGGKVDVKIEEKDLRIDVYRSIGPGGQC